MQIEALTTHFLTAGDETKEVAIVSSKIKKQTKCFIPAHPKYQLRWNTQAKIEKVKLRYVPKNRSFPKEPAFNENKPWIMGSRLMVLSLCTVGLIFSIKTQPAYAVVQNERPNQDREVISTNEAAEVLATDIAITSSNAITPPLVNNAKQHSNRASTRARTQVRTVARATMQETDEEILDAPVVPIDGPRPNPFQ